MTDGWPLGESESPPGTELLGRVVDERYRIVELLGEGGMGLVFRAEHLSLARPVALKVLQQEFAEHAELKTRFEREARALAALSHPNIVAINDYGVMDEKTPYLVMELLEGETLHQRLRGGPVPPDRVATITRQMLRALAHAHQQGLVHRDLKPGNIFLVHLPDATDHVKLLDFGLVRFLTDTHRPDDHILTHAGSMLGTPAYMAPEQVSGQPTDARTDVYATGVVLFEMLTGRKPFVGEPAEILRHHLLTPPPPLTSVLPGLVDAEDLQRVLHRALEKEPRQRFLDATELLTALENVTWPSSLEGAAYAAGPAELATMPTMHAAAKGPVPPTRGQPLPDHIATVVSTGRGARPDPNATTSTTMRVDRSALARLKRTLLAVGAGLGIAGLLVALILVAASGEESPSDGPDLHPASATDSPGRSSADAPRGDDSDRPGSPPPDEADPQSPEVEDPSPTEAEPVASSEARPPPSDPWAGRMPRSLARAKRAVRNRGPTSTRLDRGLIQYARNHAGDPRPHLLLARAYLSRGWRSDAIERYELAFAQDASSRGDPHMLSDLLTLATQDSVAPRAARAVQRIYGSEALPEIDRRLGSESLNRNSRSRLERLKETIESP